MPNIFRVWLLYITAFAPTQPTLSECWGSVEGAGASLKPVNTKHVYNICTMLDQRRRRWANVVQMLFKCFVFAG